MVKISAWKARIVTVPKPWLGGHNDRQQMSHNNFLLHRDWASLGRFWYNVVPEPTKFPLIISGDSSYGVTDLQNLNCDGFIDNHNTHTKRKRFAVRVGYVGSMYNGYGRRPDTRGHRNVEVDVEKAFGSGCFGSGRTSVNVSAISQVVTVEGDGFDNPEAIIRRMYRSEPILSGRMAAYQCVRVPDKFTISDRILWRRYLSVIPLNEGDYVGGFDIDVDFINDTLQRLVDLDLRFDGFSKNNIRESSSSDFAATLYRVKTSVIDMRDQNPSTEEEIPELFAWGSRASFFVPEVYATNNMVTSTNSALCIEIVGSDNIRKTFDRIVSTVVRESIMAREARNANILEDICRTGEYAKAAHPLPGLSNCLAGLGFQPVEHSHLMAIKAKTDVYKKISWFSNYTCKPSSDAGTVVNRQQHQNQPVSREKKKP